MIFYLLIGIVIFGILAFFVTSSSKKESKIISVKKDVQKKDSSVKVGHCPICNSPLFGNEKIISHIFELSKSALNVSDRRCNILGCPHCYPQINENVERVCPVCKKHIPSDGYLITRMFERSQHKQHVHVVGCTECAKK